MTITSSDHVEPGLASVEKHIVCAGPLVVAAAWPSNDVLGVSAPLFSTASTIAKAIQ